MDPSVNLPAGVLDYVPGSAAGSVIPIVRAEAAMRECCFESVLPACAGPALERLYGSCFSTLLHESIHGAGEALAAYLAWEGEAEPTADALKVVLLYRIEGSRLRVLNEALRMEAPDVLRFVRFVFERYPAVQAVQWRALRCGPLHSPVPLQRIGHLEDIVVALPASVDDYMRGLGKNARRNLRRYSARLREAHPGCDFALLQREDIGAALVNDILRLNRLRMVGKSKDWGVRPGQAESLLAEARVAGMAGIVRLGGRLCAGAIGIRTHDSFTLFVIAHDPDFDAFSLGFLCCHQVIASCIAQGCREFHFLWGEYEYKTALGGVRHDLDRLVFYRSRLQQLRHAGLALEVMLAGWRRRAAALWRGQQRARQRARAWLRSVFLARR